MFSTDFESDSNQEKNTYLFIKGAESAILPRCIDGPIDKTYDIVDQFANEGLRTLVYAYKMLAPEELKVFKENLELAKQDMKHRLVRTKIFNSTYVNK